MNYDARLEPRSRERSAEEVEDIVKDKYREWLFTLPVDKAWERLSPFSRTDIAETIVSEIAESRDPKRDPEFYNALDWSEINVEES